MTSVIEDFSKQLIETITQEAPKESPLSQIDRLTFDTMLGVCHLIVKDRCTFYRRLAPTHLEKLKTLKSDDATAEFAKEIAKSFLKLPPHFQLTMGMSQALYDEMHEAMQKPTQKQKSFLEKQKIFDFCQVDTFPSTPDMPVKSCVFHENSTLDTETLFSQKLNAIMAPCTTALTNMVEKIVTASSIAISGENQTVLVGSITRKSLDRFIDFFLDNDKKMRQVIAKSDSSIQEIIASFLKPHHSLQVEVVQ